MTVDTEYRSALGAYLLGALDPDEEARLVEHLRSCPGCHAEVLELGGVVADLAVLAPAASTRAGRRGATVARRRLFAVAAAAACLATVGGVGFAVGQVAGGPSGSATAAAPTSPAGARTVEGRGTTTTVTGYAVLTPAAWGTGIQLTVAGTQQTVAAGVRCTLLAVSRTGETDTAGTWVVPARSPTPEGEHIHASTGIPLRELAKLVVATDGREILALSV